MDLEAQMFGQKPYSAILVLQCSALKILKPDCDNETHFNTYPSFHQNTYFATGHAMMRPGMWSSVLVGRFVVVKTLWRYSQKARNGPGIEQLERSDKDDKGG